MGCSTCWSECSQAVNFWKGRGAQSDPASYRQILLLSSIAKCTHQSLRPALQDLYIPATPELQVGGKPGMSVIYGGHLVRSFLRWQSQAKQTCFVLYTDISFAFYSVARQLVAKDSGSDGTDGCINLCGINLPQEDLEMLREHACEPSALQQAAGAIH